MHGLELILDSLNCLNMFVCDFMFYITHNPVTMEISDLLSEKQFHLQYMNYFIFNEYFCNVLNMTHIQYCTVTVCNILNKRLKLAKSYAHRT